MLALSLRWDVEVEIFAVGARGLGQRPTQKEVFIPELFPKD